MYLGWTSSGHETYTNVDVHDNIVTNAGWDGIQLNYATSQAKIHDNQITTYGVHSDNFTPNYYQNKGIVVGWSQLSIYNNTVYSSGTKGGSPIFIQAYDDTKVYNNLLVYTGSSGDPVLEPGIEITDPASGYLSGKTISLLNNTIVTPEGAGIDDNSSSTTVNVTNNIVAAPNIAGAYARNLGDSHGVYGTMNLTTNLFTSTVSAAGFLNPAGLDYHLASSSAAINSGTDTSALGVTLDIDDTPRPQGSAFDIGAFEYIAIQILTPAGTGTATGSSYCPASGAFDAPPTWDAPTVQPVGTQSDSVASTATDYANRYFYIDLGADWAKWRILSTWTRYRPYSSGTYTGFPLLWWDSNTDTVNSGTTETRLNFEKGVVPNLATQVWAKDSDETGAPVVPQGRYLMVSTGPTPSSRPDEFAFAGYKVP